MRTPSSSPSTMIGRRQILKMGGLLAASVGGSAMLAACGGSGGASSGGKSLVFSTPTDATSTINLFKKYCSDFANSSPGTSVSVVETAAAILISGCNLTSPRAMRLTSSA